jgi:hypothetical protein
LSGTGQARLNAGRRPSLLAGGAAVIENAQTWLTTPLETLNGGHRARCHSDIEDDTLILD